MGFETKRKTPPEAMLCIDRYGAGKAEIRFYSSLGSEKKFCELSELLMYMNELYDTYKYPPASTKVRVFENGTIKEPQLSIITEEGIINMDQNEKGNKGTFVIRIEHRQNATWQGSIRWIEKDETKPFRSALEMMKLIDSAMCETDNTEEEKNV